MLRSAKKISIGAKNGQEEKDTKSIQNYNGLIVAPEINFFGLVIKNNAPIDQRIKDFFSENGGYIGRVKVDNNLFVKITGNFNITRKEVEDFIANNSDFTPTATIVETVITADQNTIPMAVSIENEQTISTLENIHNHAEHAISTNASASTSGINTDTIVDNINTLSLSGSSANFIDPIMKKSIYDSISNHSNGNILNFRCGTQNSIYKYSLMKAGEKFNIEAGTGFHNRGAAIISTKESLAQHSQIKTENSLISQGVEFDFSPDIKAGYLGEISSMSNLSFSAGQEIYIANSVVSAVADLNLSTGKNGNIRIELDLDRQWMNNPYAGLYYKYLKHYPNLVVQENVEAANTPRNTLHM